MVEGNGTGTSVVTTESVSGSLALQMFKLIASASENKDVDVAKMQALLEMQRQLIADQAKAEFNQDFARLLPHLPRITKKGTVRYPVNKNDPDSPTREAFKYARVEDIDDEIRPLLRQYGFHIWYDSEFLTDGRIIKIGHLEHVGGHTRTVKVGPLKLDTSGGKNDVQAMGSSGSYGNRYCTRDLLNLIFEGEDDDGVAGGSAGGLISTEQVEALERMLTETRSDKPAFLKYMGVKSLAEIEDSQFAAGINSLRRKAAKNAAGGTAQQRPAGTLKPFEKCPIPRDCGQRQQCQGQCGVAHDLRKANDGFVRAP